MAMAIKQLLPTQKLSIGFVLVLVLASFGGLEAQDLESSSTTVKKALNTESSLEPELALPEDVADVGVAAEELLIAKEETLFQKDALDSEALMKMDCHLRNVDYCYAGLMATSERMLPETDAQLETRCDEMRAATSCMALYNKRCSTMKIFAMLAPFAGLEKSPETETFQLPPIAEELLMNNDKLTDQGSQIKVADLMRICEPQAKGTKPNTLLRKRLFQLGKCINQRVPSLRPCIEDLKTAMQLFYEPSRSLPLKPTCCAVSRFRHCAIRALDDICGLSSFDQLEASFSSGAGSMIKTVDRVCKQGNNFRSSYCIEVLPPSGLKAPQRRGNKASKLSRALDLIQFAPPAQAD